MVPRGGFTGRWCGVGNLREIISFFFEIFYLFSRYYSSVINERNSFLRVTNVFYAPTGQRLSVGVNRVPHDGESVIRSGWKFQNLHLRADLNGCHHQVENIRVFKGTTGRQIAGARVVDGLSDLHFEAPVNHSDMLFVDFFGGMQEIQGGLVLGVKTFPDDRNHARRRPSLGEPWIHFRQRWPLAAQITAVGPCRTDGYANIAFRVIAVPPNTLCLSLYDGGRLLGNVFPSDINGPFAATFVDCEIDADICAGRALTLRAQQPKTQVVHTRRGVIRRPERQLEFSTLTARKFIFQPHE